MYALTLSNNVLRASDCALIPKDPNNSDYEQYLAWVAAGNTPVPAPADSTYAWNGSAWAQSSQGAKQDTFTTAVNAGYDTGLGWHLPLDDGARALITSGAALIVSAVEGYQLTSNTTALNSFLASNYTFVDVTGVVRTVTVQQAISINIGYGQYYQQIWSAAQ